MMRGGTIETIDSRWRKITRIWRDAPRPSVITATQPSAAGCSSWSWSSRRYDSACRRTARCLPRRDGVAREGGRPALRPALCAHTWQAAARHNANNNRPCPLAGPLPSEGCLIQSTIRTRARRGCQRGRQQAPTSPCGFLWHHAPALRERDGLKVHRRLGI